jgi:hypothetical protein
MRVILVIGTVVLLMYVIYRAFNKPSQTDVIKEKNVDILEKLRAESQNFETKQAAQPAPPASADATHSNPESTNGDVTFEPIEEAVEGDAVPDAAESPADQP